MEFKRTVARWNDFCRKQAVDPDFERPSCLDNVTLYEVLYYAEKRAPGVHHSMGGIKIDTQTRVIGTDGKPIPGLFVAGEVTGGIHRTNASVQTPFRTPSRSVIWPARPQPASSVLPFFHRRGRLLLKARVDP